MISHYLDLLCFALLPRMCPILVDVLWVLKKSVFCCQGRVFYMCRLDSDGLIVLFSSSVPLLVFCLVLSVAERRMLKWPSVIVDFSLFSQLYQLLLHIFEALFGAYKFRILTSSWWLILLSLYIMVSFYSVNW